MHSRILKLSDKIIEFSFYLLFFLVPLILTPFNYELFEYNKMMVTYALTTIIVGSWLIKMIINKKLKFARTPLDLPLLLFLLSQIISTIFSIDRHVSIWGYYSRFNGGLLSTISYIMLYYAFVSNFPKEKVRKLLTVIVTSAVLVSLYGILEHFGIDRDIWVQDVQNRVFSTLGQPNWLAAYLAVLIPLSIGFTISNIKYQISRPKADQPLAENIQIKNQKFNKGLDAKKKPPPLIVALLYCCIVAFYITLLFTKSRSGFLGFWIANGSFWIFLFWYFREKFLKSFLLLNSLFLILTFLFGAPIPQVNKFTLSQLTIRKSSSDKAMTTEQANKPIGSSIIDVGITESGIIRRIVWKGAIDIARHYPLFGTGVETFAFSYYQFRPIEHNNTSEWDFLYNKAHNEYLNYAANSGIFGLGSYLLIIGVFIWSFFRQLKVQSSKLKVTTQSEKLLAFNFNFDFYALRFALFAGFASILVTNFFGFSVVIIQLFFFLIPAICFVLTKIYIKQETNNIKHLKINNNQLALSTIVLIVICYMLYVISRMWWADVHFARGFHAVRAQEYSSAYLVLKQAILTNDNEPFYHDELSHPAAQLAVALSDNGDSTNSASLKEEAIAQSNLAISISQNNVNFWKTRTRVFYTLSQIDENYLSDAEQALIKAKLLSPTDPKITYNLAILKQTIGETEEAFSLLDDTIILKPDYRDAYFAKAVLYEQDKKIDYAREALTFILEKINPNDEEARTKLEELK